MIFHRIALIALAALLVGPAASAAQNGARIATPAVLRTNVQRVLIVLLPITLLLAQRVGAQEVHWDLFSKRIEVLVPPGGFVGGAEVEILCEYDYHAKTPSGAFVFPELPTAPAPVFKLDIQVDGKTVASYDITPKLDWEPVYGGGYILDTTGPDLERSTLWKSTTGNHVARCLLNPSGFPEITPANNTAQKAFSVGGGRALAIPAARQQTRGSNAMLATTVPATLGRATNTRACKGHVVAAVELSPEQFTQPKPETSPKKMNLHLSGSIAKGDYVHCEYASVGKDLLMVTTYSCKGASPDAKAGHTYQCAE